MSSDQKRIEILKRAAEVTGGERQDSYGPVKDNLTNIAEFWSAYLSQRNGIHVEVDASDAAWMMVMLKAARSLNGGYHEDNYVDAAAYAAIAGECACE
jgi:hypothetical protein